MIYPLGVMASDELRELHRAILSLVELADEESRALVRLFFTTGEQGERV